MSTGGPAPVGGNGWSYAFGVFKNPQWGMKKTVGAVAGYLAVAGFVGQTEIFQSPDHLLNGVHKTSNFIKKWLQSKVCECPQPRVGDPWDEFKDETYYAHAKADPNFGRFGGFRNELRYGVAAAEIIGGTWLTLDLLTHWVQAPAKGSGYPAQMSGARKLAWTGVLGATYFAARSLADFLGNSYGRPDGHMEASDFSLNLYAAEWANNGLFSIPLAKNGKFAANGGDALYHWLGKKLGNTRGASYFFKTSSHFSTARAEILGVNKAVKLATLYGKNKGNVMGKVVLAGAALAGIVFGARSLYRLATGQSRDTFNDTYMSLIGGVAALASAAVMVLPRARNLFRFLSFSFGGARFGYILAFTLIGGTSTATINCSIRWLQGLRRKEYYIMQWHRSYYGPLPNRITYNVWSSLTPAPLSLTAFVMPGQYLVFQPFEVKEQRHEVIGHEYREIAQEFRLAETPADAGEKAARLKGKEEDLAETMRRKGIAQLNPVPYNEETYQKAYRHAHPLAQQYAKIQELKREFSIAEDELRPSEPLGPSV